MLHSDVVHSECQEIILASSSPRRADLLRQAGVPFHVVVAPVEEEPEPREQPEQTALRLALDKALAAARQTGTGVVLGADTVVALGDRILGKPRDPGEAAEMLRALRARRHRVITGVAVVNVESGRRHGEAVVTQVWMRRYTEDEIAAYVASGEPMDKAGAYAIQSGIARLVQRIEGCYTNVVGLPLCAVARGLEAVDCPIKLALAPDEAEPYLSCPECRSLAHLQ